VTRAVIQARLAELGATPDIKGQRGLFGRGLREVWLAQGGGRIIGIRDRQLVEAWFLLHETQAFAFQIVREQPVTEIDREETGIREDGTCVFVPLASDVPSPGRVRRLLADHVQLRPVLEDPNRDVWLHVEDAVDRVLFEAPEPDPDRPVLFDGEVRVAPDAVARVTIRRSRTPLPLNVARSLRRGGLLIRSGRSAHEATLGRFDNRPGAQHLYGDVRLDALDDVQRRDLDSMKPELVVRVDRSGLNEHHPLARSCTSAWMPSSSRSFSRRNDAPEPLDWKSRKQPGAGTWKVCERSIVSFDSFSARTDLRRWLRGILRQPLRRAISRSRCGWMNVSAKSPKSAPTRRRSSRRRCSSSDHRCACTPASRVTSHSWQTPIRSRSTLRSSWMSTARYTRALCRRVGQ
jgi:hypothetical protein